MAQKKAEDRFEMAKVMELAEPLLVYLERYQGTTSEPVALPALGRDRNIDPNGTPGSGWLRDDVAKLAPWIKDFWTGAGTYRAQVVDQNKKVLEWEFSIQLSDTVKQKTPPPLGTANIVPPSAIQQVAPAALVPAPPQVQLGQPPQQQAMQWGAQQHAPMGPWQNAPAPQPPPPWSQQGWSPPTAPPPQVMYPPGPPQQGYGPMAPWNPYGPPQQPPWAQQWGQPAPTRDKEVESEVKRIKEELDASKRREIELKAQQELEKARADHARDMDALRNEIRAGKETSSTKEQDEVRRAREDRDRMERDRERQAIDQKFEALTGAIKELAASKNRPDEDDKFRRLEEDNRRRDEAAAREREKEREEHRRELEKRDAQAREENLRREMKEQAERTERLFRESQNKGPDPMLEFIKENQRQAMQTQERIAQMQATQFSSLQSSTINPMQLLTILEKRDSSGDQFIRNMMPALTGVIELYRGAAENVVGLAGGGPAAAWQPVAEQAINSGKEILDRYFTWKRDESVSGNKAKIAASEAQAQSAHAAAQAQAAVAAMQHRAQAAQAPAQPEASQPGPVNGAASQPLNGAAQTAAPAANGQVIPIRKPPSEVELFGKAYESVQKLRLGVKNKHLDPGKAIDAILSGIAYMEEHNQKHPPGSPEHAVIPAFQLYAQERWADFVDILLPQASEEFKAECVRILVEETEPAPGQKAPADPDVQV